MSIANPDISDITLDDCPLCHSAIEEGAYWFTCVKCDLGIYTRYSNAYSIHRTVGRYVVFWDFAMRRCEMSGTSVRQMYRQSIRIPWQALNTSEDDIAKYMVLL